MNSQKWKLVGLAALLMLTASLQAAAQSKYIGLKYETGQLPEELESTGGWLVAESDETITDSRHMVTTIKPAGRESYIPTMLWFEKTIKDLMTDRSRVLNEVVDVLELTELQEGKELARGDCTVWGKRDPQVFAIADWVDKEFFTRFVKVWRANVRTEKFEEISANGVKCENIGYGV